VKYQTLHYLTIIYRHTYYDHTLPCALTCKARLKQELSLILGHGVYLCFQVSTTCDESRQLTAAV